MNHKKAAFRGLLSTMVVVVCLLAFTTAGLSAATISTSVSGTGSITTKYTNFVEVTNPATMVSN